MVDLTTALPAFTITLREGVEAALVVGIVLTYLHRAGRSSLSPWVYWGLGSGIVGSVALGGGLTWLLYGLSVAPQPVMSVVKPLVEAIAGCVAIVLLSWMLIWMTHQGKMMKAEVEQAVQSALTAEPSADERIGWSLFAIVLFAVLREGFETVLFLALQVQQGGLPVAGAIAGLVTAATIGLLLFRFGVRLNIRRFFQVMGIFLLLIVAGLVVGVCRQLDATLLALASSSPTLVPFCQGGNATCILGPLVWDGSSVLPDREFPGVVLKALFGYRQHLYLAQVISYLVFLGVVGTLYVQSMVERSKPSSVLKQQY